jgi:hypothetical protein
MVHSKSRGEKDMERFQRFSLALRQGSNPSKRAWRRLTLVVILICAMALGVVSTAHAEEGVGTLDGEIACNQTAQPPEESRGRLNYYGGATCGGRGVDTWRLRIELWQEVVNPGPIPNTWEHVAHSGWSQWAASGATRSRNEYIDCSDLEHDNWEYRARFRLEVDWSDGHETEHLGGFSATRRLC